MRPFILMAALMMEPRLSAQQWTPWKVSATFAMDSEGYKSFRNMKGKDSTGAVWQITWDPAAVVVTAPNGSRKALDKAFPVEAHPHGAMSISNSDIEHWRNRGWECFRVRIDTGRNGIGLDYYLVVVIDRRSGEWAVCSGRVADESMEDPSLVGDSLTLRWSDEEEKRPLRIKHEWGAVRTEGGLRVINSPVVYQLEYGYPYWFRFWSDVTSPDPNIAEHQGWLSVAWRVAGVDKSGGAAESARTSIPKVPGKQVWQRGTGPDIWFPVMGTVKFRWAEEVEARRFSCSVEKLHPEAAVRLATQGGWDIVLTRDGKGNYLGAMLIEKEVRLPTR